MSLGRAMTAKYLFVLGLLAALSVSNYRMMQTTIETQGHDALIVNLSGRQRMLSQRIASLSLQSAHSRDPAERRALRDRLIETTELMDASSKSLLALAGPEPRKKLSPRREAGYPETLRAFDAQLRRYLDTARKLASQLDSGRPDPALLRSVTVGAEDILQPLDEAVRQHQLEGEARVAGLERLQKQVLVWIFLVLLLSGLLIFRPMVRRVLEEQRKLADLNASLEQKVSQRTKEIAEIRNRFIHTVNHELRTPISCINGALLAFLDEPGAAPDPRRARYLDIVVRAAKLLTSMVDDLLTATSVETEKLRIERVPVSLPDLIKETVASLELIAAPRGVSLRTDIADELPPAHADPVRVRQILVNLISNAIKFTPKGGRISVEAKILREAPPCLAVSVADTGCGIKPEELALLFDKAHQVAAHADGKLKGLGLGLHISRELVTRQDGRIWVESAPGKGSTFTFTLPVAAEEAAPVRQDVASSPPPQRAAATQGERTLLLVVDDDPDVRKTLRLVLGDAYTVLEAASGTEALGVLQEQSPKLMLLDVSMPGLDGIALLEALRADGKSLPVIMLTSVKELEIAERALNLGAVEYVTKPFDPEFLKAEIGRLLEGNSRAKPRQDSPWRVVS